MRIYKKNGTILITAELDEELIAKYKKEIEEEVDRQRSQASLAANKAAAETERLVKLLVRHNSYILKMGMRFDYQQTDDIDHIDGYLITDGETVRIILKRHLTDSEKYEGVNSLMENIKGTIKPGVYLWRANGSTVKPIRINRDTGLNRTNCA